MNQIRKGDVFEHETTSLTAISDAYMKPVGHQGQKQQHVMVSCSCGDSEPFECAAHRLRSKKQPTKSCGCIRIPAVKKKCFKQVKAGQTWKGKYTKLTAVCDGYMEIGADGKRWQHVKVQCSCEDEPVFDTRVYGLGKTTSSCGCAMPRLVADAQREPVKKGTTWGGPETHVIAISDGYYEPYCGEGNHQFVDVKCSCGKIKLKVLVSNLQGGYTVSCGCYQKEITSRKNAERNSRLEGRGHRRWIYRNGSDVIEMLSAWELAFAHHLDNESTTWQYEPEWFKFGEGIRYCPDFYLPEKDEWFEIKADHLLDDFNQKASLFRGMGHSLHVLSGKQFHNYIGMKEFSLRKKYDHCHWQK